MSRTVFAESTNGSVLLHDAASPVDIAPSSHSVKSPFLRLLLRGATGASVK
jgi:hypothetical protein